MFPVLRGQAHTADILYHYTDMHGLLGIAKSKCLWATDYRYLNDSSEGSDVFRDAISLKNSLSLSEFGRKTEFEGELSNLYGISRDRAGGAPSQPHYIFSLSEKDDQLSQWRAYGRGGYGFAVGFDRAALETTVATLPGASLGACRYGGTRDIESKVRECVDAAAREYGASERYVAAGMASATCFYRWALFYKNEKFDEEREWRVVVSSGSPEIHYREGTSMLVPYVKLPGGQTQLDLSSLIADIVVGPCPHPELARKAVVGTTGLSSTRVRSSTIPYRSW